MSTARIYVGHLAKHTQDRDVQELFDKYGRVENVVMKQGFAFVEMPDARSAANAVAALDGREFDGSRIVVQTAKGGVRDSERKRQRTDFRIIVEGVPERCSWQDLKDFGREAGRVLFTDVKIHNGRKAGIIEFEQEDAMQYALRNLNDRRIHGEPIRLAQENASDPIPTHRRSRSRDAPAPRRGDRSRSRDGRRFDRAPSLPPRIRGEDRRWSSDDRDFRDIGRRGVESDRQRYAPVIARRDSRDRQYSDRRNFDRREYDRREYRRPEYERGENNRSRRW